MPGIGQKWRGSLCPRHQPPARPLSRYNVVLLMTRIRRPEGVNPWAEFSGSESSYPLLSC